MKSLAYTLLRSIWTLYKKIILTPLYAIKDTEYMWYLRNWHYRALQEKSPLPLNPLQQRILNDLKVDGIAITHIDELFPESDWQKILTEYGNALRANSFQNKTKTYWQEMWDVKSFLLDLKNPFARFAIEEKNIAIANAYQGMYSRLHSIGLSETMPVAPGTPAIQSQQWHRDIGNKTYPKIFVYLSDVGEEDGPFIYLKGSQMHGRWYHLFPQINPHTNALGRIQDADIEKSPMQADIVKCTGRAGTLVFADTAGIHKGGYSTRNPRFASIITFYSHKSLERRKYKSRHFTYPADFNEQIRLLSKPVQSALKRFT